MLSSSSGCLDVKEAGVGAGTGVDRDDWPLHTVDGSLVGSCR